MVASGLGCDVFKGGCQGVGPAVMEAFLSGMVPTENETVTEELKNGTPKNCKQIKIQLKHTFRH